MSKKTPAISVFLLFIFFPSFQSKVFGLFFLLVFSLISDIINKRIELLTFLTYTRERIHLYEFCFLSFLTLLSFFVSLPFYGSFQSLFLDLTNVFIYLLGYFGGIISLTMLGVDGIAAAFIFLFLDKAFSSFPTFSDKFVNFYTLISPSRQGNLISSLVFSIVLFLSGYFLLSKRGGEKWFGWQILKIMLS